MIFFVLLTTLHVGCAACGRPVPAVTHNCVYCGAENIVPEEEEVDLDFIFDPEDLFDDYDESEVLELQDLEELKVVAECLSHSIESALLVVPAMGADNETLRGVPWRICAMQGPTWLGRFSMMFPQGEGAATLIFIHTRPLRQGPSGFGFPGARDSRQMCHMHPQESMRSPVLTETTCREHSASFFARMALS